jgi:hypothetical protein
MEVNFKNNCFFLNNRKISLDETMRLWLSSLEINWKQSAFKQMLKLNNIQL